MMEHTETEHLALCVCPQICFEAEGINCGDEGFDDVEGRTRNRCILGHMTSVTITITTMRLFIVFC